MIRPGLMNIKNFKTGDIILQHTDSYWYKPNTRAGYIIRRLTRSNRNHSGEVLIIKDQIYVIESLGGGITLTSWDTFKKPDKYIKVLRMKGFKYYEKDYIIKALKQLDKTYDYFGIFKLFILICFGWRQKPDKEISESHWRCSEFNAWMKDLDGWQSYMPKDFEKDNRFTVIN